MFLLLLSVVALAWPGMTSPPVLDDTLQTQHVATFESVVDCFTQPDCFGFMRPVKNLIYYAFHVSGNASPLTWHGFNLATHLLAVIAVYFLARRLIQPWPWALAAAGLWALTPTMTCASIWMSCANINLGVGFLSLFLLAHLRSQASEKQSVGFTTVSGLILFLSLFFYESLVVAVGLAFLCDRLVHQIKPTRPQMITYAIYGVTTVVYLAIRSMLGATQTSAGVSPGFPPDTTPFQVFLSAPWFLLMHFKMWLFPINKIEFVSSYLWGVSASPKDLIASWIIVLMIAGGAIAIWRRSPLFAFGLLWFGVASFPSSNFIPIFAGPIADYYLIISSIGLALVVATMARGLFRSKDHPEWNNPKLVVGVMLAALFLWRATFVPLYPQRAQLWNDPAALFLDVTQTRDHQYLATSLAAIELANRGMPDEALILADQAIEAAPFYAPSYLVAGFAYSKQGKAEEALGHLSKALDQHGLTEFQVRAAHRESARLQIHQGDFAGARNSLLPLLEAEYDHEQKIPAILLMSSLYEKQANRERAIATIEKGLGIYPDEQDLIAALKELDLPSETTKP